MDMPKLNENAYCRGCSATACKKRRFAKLVQCDIPKATLIFEDQMMDFLRAFLIPSVAALSLAGCGGPKTGSGVSFKAQDAGAMADMCKERLPGVIDPLGMRGIPKKVVNKAVRTCCKPVKKEASKLDKKQRAFAWYNWALDDDINQTPNELAKLRAAKDALRADLTTVEYSAAAAIETKATLCAVQVMRQSGIR
ncbi:MAG: hypothetical protein AAF850_07770 [Pseudomonadota bacterium]